MSKDWNQIRSNYQLPQNRTYLNSASFGAMSDRTIQVQMECLTSWQKEGNHLNERANQAAVTIKDEILNLTNARQHEVALVSDVSTVMNQLADLLKHDKNKVALLKEDYPATSVPWIVRGFEISWVERKDYNYLIEDIEEVILAGADVLVMSWVMYNTGAVLDLKTIGDLCKKNGVVFIVDATQGLIANPIDLTEVHVDVVLASAFKWMLGGYGIAIAMASKAFVMDHEIRLAGQNTIISNEKDVTDRENYRNGIERLELGHAKIQQILALENAILELKTIGLAPIIQRTFALRDYLKSGLESIGIEVITPGPGSSSILMIKSTKERVAKLQNASIDHTARHNLIRLGLYFYNNENDLNRLIQCLK